MNVNGRPGQKGNKNLWRSEAPPTTTQCEESNSSVLATNPAYNSSGNFSSSYAAFRNSSNVSSTGFALQPAGNSSGFPINLLGSDGTKYTHPTEKMMEGHSFDPRSNMGRENLGQPPSSFGSSNAVRKNPVDPTSQLGGAHIKSDNGKHTNRNRESTVTNRGQSGAAGTESQMFYNTQYEDDEVLRNTNLPMTTTSSVSTYSQVVMGTSSNSAVRSSSYGADDGIYMPSPSVHYGYEGDPRKVIQPPNKKLNYFGEVTTTSCGTSATSEHMYNQMVYSTEHQNVQLTGVTYTTTSSYTSLPPSQSVYSEQQRAMVQSLPDTANSEWGLKQGGNNIPQGQLQQHPFPVGTQSQYQLTGQLEQHDSLQNGHSQYGAPSQNFLHQQIVSQGLVAQQQPTYINSALGQGFGSQNQQVATPDDLLQSSLNSQLLSQELENMNLNAHQELSSAFPNVSQSSLNFVSQQLGNYGAPAMSSGYSSQQFSNTSSFGASTFPSFLPDFSQPPPNLISQQNFPTNAPRPPQGRISAVQGPPVGAGLRPGVDFSGQQELSYRPPAHQLTRYPFRPAAPVAPRTHTLAAGAENVAASPQMPSTAGPSSSFAFPGSVEYEQQQAFPPQFPSNSFLGQPSLNHFNMMQSASSPSMQEGYGQRTGPPVLPPDSLQRQHLQSSSLSKKLDPEMMPNAIQVMKDDQEARGGEIFLTARLSVVPPLVTTKFIADDNGNASPRFLRSTVYTIPRSSDLLKQANMPIGLIISPLAKVLDTEETPSVVDLGPNGPVRCARCKAYVNPNMHFIDGGLRFFCVICKGITEVREDYFQHLDHTGQRVDRLERPELLYGVYEFVVTPDYCRPNTVQNTTAMMFLIDVSYASVKSDMVKTFFANIRDLLRQLPTDEVNGGKIEVAFATYSNVVHFYNISPSLAQPQMIAATDLDSTFVPFTDGLFGDPAESDANIGHLMTRVPEMFHNTRITEVTLAPAVKTAIEAFKVKKCVGKIFIFHSSLPTAECYGRLEHREERQLLGSDKEKNALSPQTKDYVTLAEECMKNGIGVDMFIFNNGPVDLPTIGQLSRITGGEVFKYTYFDPNTDGERFCKDLRHVLTRETGYDAILKVRTSTGIRPVHYYGEYHSTVASEIEFGTINQDKAIAVELVHDDKLPENDTVYIQAALLYTTMFGHRRVRVINMAMSSCVQMSDLYRLCDLDALMNFYSKMMLMKLMESTPRQVKEAVTNRCAQSLACYRKVCAAPSSPGQLILPECLKLLPLYLNCLLKCDAIAGGPDMTVDDRWLMMHILSNADVTLSAVYIYPRIVRVINPETGPFEDLNPVRCTSLKLTSNDIYVLENGVYIFVWVGAAVSNEHFKNIFGVDRATESVSHTYLLRFDNEISRRLHSTMEKLQSDRYRSMKLTVALEGDRVEIIFKHYLVEDSGSGSGFDGYSVSYVDFLCHLHRQIRTIIG